VREERFKNDTKESQDNAKVSGWPSLEEGLGPRRPAEKLSVTALGNATSAPDHHWSRMAPQAHAVPHWAHACASTRCCYFAPESSWYQPPPSWSYSSAWKREKMGVF